MEGGVSADVRVLLMLPVAQVRYSYQSRITNQLQRLGGSYDWNRVAFTMNEVRLLFLSRSKAVRRTVESYLSHGVTARIRADTLWDLWK